MGNENPMVSMLVTCALSGPAQCLGVHAPLSGRLLPRQHETTGAGTGKLREPCRHVLPATSLRIDQGSHRLGKVHRDLRVSYIVVRLIANRFGAESMPRPTERPHQCGFLSMSMTPATASTRLHSDSRSYLDHPKPS
jgi:hypothetical protein